MTDETPESLRKLSPERRRALELHLDGNTVTDIAKAVGFTRRSVHYWMRTEEWQDAQDDLLRAERGTARVKLAGMLPNALRAIDKALKQAKDPRLRLQAAREVLDRLGVVGEKFGKALNEAGLEEFSEAELEAALRERGFVNVADLGAEELRAMADARDAGELS